MVWVQNLTKWSALPQRWHTGLGGLGGTAGAGVAVTPGVKGIGELPQLLDEVAGALPRKGCLTLTVGALCFVL